jgi:hypothetical protein
MIISNGSSMPDTKIGARAKENVPISAEKLNKTVVLRDAGRQADRIQVSTLARQLEASAALADERSRTLTRSQLADKAGEFGRALCASAWDPSLHEQRDKEVPATDDPELLERARQATDFLKARVTGKNVPNPFSSLSTEDLSNIVHDDSGAYTFNERSAAFDEAYQREYVWREKVAREAMDEYNRTGKLTHFFQSVLDHYNSLPAMEQATYPADYAFELSKKIDSDFNYLNHRKEGEGGNLIDILFEGNPSGFPRIHEM